jgi:ribosome-binding factor A
MASRKGSGSRRYPRTARLNELFREILGDEVERLDDDRLELVTIMGVEVQTDLERATVYWSTVFADADNDGRDAAIQEAFAELRPRLQAAIGRQARVRRVPELVFRPDPSVRSAERIEGILRDLHLDGDDAPGPGGSETPEEADASDEPAESDDA